MARQPRPQSGPNSVIDLHGLRDALKNRSNRVIAGIQAGQIAVLRSARDGLEKAYPDLYSRFQGIPGRRSYVEVSVGHKAAAAVLLERYGASVFSAKPPIASFQNLAVAREEGWILISSEKGLDDLRDIVQECGLGHNMIADIADA